MKTDFTSLEKRSLELSQTEDMSVPEAVALRKILDAFPWITTVADCKYDPHVSACAIAYHAHVIQFQEAVDTYNRKSKSMGKESV